MDAAQHREPHPKLGAVPLSSHQHDKKYGFALLNVATSVEKD